MARLDDRLDREFDPRTAKVLAKALDVHTVGELLRHYPRRYEQRGELTDLASLRDGEHVTVLAQISAVTTRAMKNRRGQADRGDRHRRPRHADPRLLPPAVAGEGHEARPARPVRRPGVLLRPQAPAHPPRLRAARHGGPGHRDGRRARGRDHPGVPGHQGAAVLEDRQGDPDRAGHARHRRRPAARRGPHPLRPAEPAGRVARHPPAGGVRRHRAGPAAAEVGRGVRAAGRAGPAAAGRGRAARHPAHPAARRAARGVRRPAAVLADQGPAHRRRGDHHRAVPGAPDAPPAAG